MNYVQLLQETKKQENYFFEAMIPIKSGPGKLCFTMSTETVIVNPKTNLDEIQKHPHSPDNYPE